MARETLISVIMSVYNGEKYLKLAIESILTQTLHDFEFIIIDDASTDSSLEIIEKFDDDRIILIRNEKNIGLTKSLNKALSVSKGKYIARMDADDISLPTRLEKQYNFLNKNENIVMVGSSTNIIDSSGKSSGSKTAVTDPDFLQFIMVYKNQISHPTVMFRKEDIIRVGGYQENIPFAQDYDLWSRLFEKGYKITNISEPLLNYRLHNSSITQGKTKEESFAVAMSIVKRNLKKYIAFSDDEFDKFAQAYNRHTIPHFKDIYILLGMWNRLKKSYPVNNVMIKSIEREKKNILLSYFRQHFGIIYKIAKKILK